jgi:hypothetical protein
MKVRIGKCHVSPSPCRFRMTTVTALKAHAGEGGRPEDHMRLPVSLAMFVICSTTSALTVGAQENVPALSVGLFSSDSDSTFRLGARAAQPERRPLSLETGPSTGALKHAIDLEATRLAQSSPASGRVQAQQPASSDNRAWCLRHSVGCGALMGYGVGFIAGLVHPVRDFSRFGWALLFSGPLGAGIGAVVGVGVS